MRRFGSYMIVMLRALWGVRTGLLHLLKCMILIILCGASEEIEPRQKPVIKQFSWYFRALKYLE